MGQVGDMGGMGEMGDVGEGNPLVFTTQRTRSRAFHAMQLRCADLH